MCLIFRQDGVDGALTVEAQGTKQISDFLFWFSSMVAEAVDDFFSSADELVGPSLHFGCKDFPA